MGFDQGTLRRGRRLSELLLPRFGGWTHVVG
jgi:hypothetical protein